MKYALVPIGDIEKLKIAEKQLLEVLELVGLKYPMYHHISSQIWTVTHRKYNEIKIDDIKHFVGRN